MNKYPRARFIVAVLIFSFVLANIPALAQNGNANNNRPQAVLYIKVNVVPTVALPHARSNPNANNAVTYNFSTVKSDVQVIEEIRPLFGNSVGQSGNREGAILKTLTVVPY